MRDPRHGSIRIAILGAESTGKSALTPRLAVRISAETGLRVACVEEHLRTWCLAHQRTPRKDEQFALARAQQEAIERAAATHDVTVADTTPLMTAIYSQYIFGDDSLMAMGLSSQKNIDRTLVTGLDLPWVADGFMRDGPSTQVAVDALLRDTLLRAGSDFSVIYGADEQRVQAAWNAVAGLFGMGEEPGSSEESDIAGAGRYPRWRCDCTDIATCERALHQRKLLPSG